MKIQSSGSYAASSAADKTPGRSPRRHAEANAEEPGDIPFAPASPYSNEEWEDLMNWDHTVKQSASPKTSIHKPASAKRYPSAPAITFSTVPDPTVKVYQASNLSREPRKRKVSPAIDGKADAVTGLGQSEPLGLKRSHNAIEKRYRTNLNHKIAALRDAVPSLRKLRAAAADDVDGPGLAHKLNKATVLSSTIEYIQHLESRNQRLEEENAVLKGRVPTLEQEENNVPLVLTEAAPEVSSEAMNSALGPASTETEDMNSALGPASTETEDSPPAFNDPQGMIHVPEEMRRLRHGAPQAHYHERSTRPLHSAGGIEVYLGAMLRMP